MNPILPKLRLWQEIIREFLFPRGCALCGKALCNKTHDPFYGLCAACRDSLSVPDAERGRCSLCGQPLISEKDICLPCRNGPERSFDRLVSLYPYMGKYKKVLAAYKFGKRLSLGNFFAEKYRESMKLFSLIENSTELVWVPVPARPGKIKKTGWDQIEYLAQLLETGSPFYQNKSIRRGTFAVTRPGRVYRVMRCLQRLPSESQKVLNRENRLQNLKGRIIIKKSAGRALPVIPKTVIIFDDVYTTGATMDACAAALKQEGAEKVYGICLCYD
jgi:predicted amidophosphoribosyltransferase